MPRVERTGIDEGYLDLGTTRRLLRGRARLAGAVQVAVRGRRPLVLARRLDVEGRLQGRLRPPQAGWDHRRPARARGRIPRAVRHPDLPGVGPRSEERLAARGSRRSARLALLSDAELRAATPRPGRPAPPRPRAWHRPARPRPRRRAHLDLDRGDVRAGPEDRASLHAELRRMAEDVAAHLRRDGHPRAR